MKKLVVVLITCLCLAGCTLTASRSHIVTPESMTDNVYLNITIGEENNE